MEKLTLSQETSTAITQAKVSADNMLQETPEQKFERAFLEIIRKEIEIGANAAASFKAMIPSASDYTYTNKFPLPIYEALSEEDLLMLEQSSIYLSKNKELGKASIRIVFHF